MGHFTHVIRLTYKTSKWRFSSSASTAWKTSAMMLAKVVGPLYSSGLVQGAFGVVWGASQEPYHPSCRCVSDHLGPPNAVPLSPIRSQLAIHAVFKQDRKDRSATSPQVSVCSRTFLVPFMVCNFLSQSWRASHKISFCFGVGKNSVLLTPSSPSPNTHPDTPASTVLATLLYNQSSPALCASPSF